MKKVKITNKRKLILIVSVVVLSTLLSLVIYRTITGVRAWDRTWSQTDWRGGTVGGVVTDTVTTYESSSDLDVDTEGEINLSMRNDWYNDSWKYRKKITIDNTQVSGTSDLINFPVLINAVNSEWADTSNGGEVAQSDGGDILFTDATGVKLNHEIESYDNISGELIAWVRVPTLQYNSDTHLYIYYGNSTGGLEESNQTEVWDNNYAGVWHLSEEEIGTGIADVYKDSTSNANHGTDYTDSTGQTGKIYNGQEFDGSNDYVNVGSAPELNITEDITLSSWIYPNSADNHSVMTWANDYSSFPFHHNISTDYIRFNGNNAGNITSNTGVSLNQWNYVVVTVDGTTLRFFLNGVPDSGNPYSLSTATRTSGDGYMSLSRIGSQMLDGFLDEARISSIARSENWIATEYNNQNNPSSFITLSSQEERYMPSGYLISNIFDPGYPTDWGELIYTELGIGNVEIRIRSDLNQGMNGAPDWSECDPIESGELISSNSCVEDGERYIQYQILLEAQDANSPTFQDISISFSASDQDPPEDNATEVYISNSVENDQWTNLIPTINWTAGIDNDGGNGVEGYCISLDEVDPNDTSRSLDPISSSGILTGIDDGVNNSACPYIIADTSVDFSEIDGLVLKSNKKYHFSIKAVDYAGNVWTGVSGGYQDLVWFKYDTTIPNNVMYISTPSTDFGNVNDMFFNWPISGSSQATDNESGILGWQYAINSSSIESWKGTDTHPKLGIPYIPLEGLTEGLLNLTSERDAANVIIGNNTIYFRAIDNAGNVSTYVTGGINYGGAAPEFPEESVVTINPTESESNEFSLSWPEATPQDGEGIESYYYMVNTQPPSSLSTLRANSNIYIPTDSLGVPTGKLVGAVKGTNNVYVVAVDNEENYSPTKAIHGTFDLNSTLPDSPQNLSVADLSIKGSELWRVALTWEEPTYKGNGDLTYIIERSGNNVTWTEVSRTSGLSYTDIVPESKTYYYKVATIDSSNESVADPSYSTVVQLHPKGRYEEPPELISEPVVSEITTRYAKVNWATDRISDSKVQLGVSSGTYFQDEMYRSDMLTNHEIELTNLSPGTQYYYRVKWTDEDGNTGASSESIFQTKPAPVVEDVQIDSVGLNYAIIKLTTTGATQAQIVYGRTKNYGGSQAINTSTASSEYSIMLTELEDGTEYHYKIVLTDEEGFEYESFEDHVFSTPPRPQVSNVQIQEKKGVPTPTIEVFWESNIAVSSIVKYSSNGKSLDKVDMELIEGEHSIEIEGLDSNSEYQLTVEGVDGMGNRAVSDVYAFTTATDTRPPKVSGIRSEGDIQSSDIQSDRSRSAQLIISWQTDEPSTSQILYGEGAASDGFPYSTQTDSQMRYEHVMIVSNLSPSKVYHFKVVSKDSAGNVGESGSVTSITPKSTDTVMESVLGSLGRIFNFL
jgi:hypothetical protein